jgi:DNA invertase Pin-like site-specific DNA recombinase
VAIFGWVAEQERARLIERTKAGLERARREGKRLGRPRASPLKLAAAAEDVARGLSRRAAARRRGVGQATLRTYLLLARKTPPRPAS